MELHNQPEVVKFIYAQLLTYQEQQVLLACGGDSRRAGDLGNQKPAEDKPFRGSRSEDEVVDIA